MRNGIRYTETNGNSGFNQRQVFTRMRFKETETKMSLEGFKMHKTPQGEFSKAFQMLSSSQLIYQHDSTVKAVNYSLKSNYNSVTPYIKYFSMTKNFVPKKVTVLPGKSVLAAVGAPNIQLSAVNNALSEARALKEQAKPRGDTYKEEDKIIRRYLIEYQKKVYFISSLFSVVFDRCAAWRYNS